MSKYIFETRMEVRDYECDIEGIVNNANYLHYTEHTRHRFLKHAGLSFARMHEKGVDAVVARMNLAFKTPLRCDDEFISRMGLRKEGYDVPDPEAGKGIQLNGDIPQDVMSKCFSEIGNK